MNLCELVAAIDRTLTITKSFWNVVGRIQIDLKAFGLWKVTVVKCVHINSTKREDVAIFNQKCCNDYPSISSFLTP